MASYKALFIQPSQGPYSFSLSVLFWFEFCCRQDLNYVDQVGFELEILLPVVIAILASFE